MKTTAARYGAWIAQAGIAGAVLLPIPAAASQAVTTAVGLFNIFVGLMLCAAILAFGSGFVIWLTRLGTWPTYRTEAIKVMEWAVAILFVLVVLLMIVQFFQKHQWIAIPLLTTAVVLVIIALIVYVVINSKGGDEKEER